MDNKILADILKFSNSYELLVVDEMNKLVVVRCPFSVMTLDSIGELMTGQIYEVDQIKVTPTLITLFMIKGRAYFYFYFDIIL
ncbi:hypothetical protein [Flagellimonas zhangzhouensis]|uniref:Uncharacterized protein n=1 Tax=Flagellimonas zhangzhouensis TaxID=1073328 RepID=A0A1H2U9Z4_9FLAO|nr:hypothetical protein [Allomuricauda zhangzhouensis]SDQ18812.1 hypothetical protein SAMN05216294_0784 [Allomuricauda zhangzhouensis]SDW52985.1 hypothetical protein SAMN04487892_1509 [Allomuricauda zhangzhouensis]